MFHSQTKLIEKIMLGEDSTIEFKREIPYRDSIADEIVVFIDDIFPMEWFIDHNDIK